MRLGVIMDPISSIHYQKDSTLSMLLAAKARGWSLFYFEQQHLYVENGQAFGLTQPLTVHANSEHWFDLAQPSKLALSDLDFLLMRKDPPCDESYLYTTFVLDHAEKANVLVANRPQALRDANEKFFISFFPHCTPPTLITASIQQLNTFWQQHSDVVCKPLNGMGGVSIFRLRPNEVNAPVILDTLTQGGTKMIMAQRFIPEIKLGDKRIILINGQPLSHALARVPQGEDWRGNLAVGAKGHVVPLSDRDHEICAAVGPELKRRGVYFAGIDVIGDYLTEINITSPTGICELNNALNINIGDLWLDCLSRHRVN